MLGRGATIISPFIVLALFRAYGVSGVTTFMIGLLVMQIAAVWLWGIEPARRGLEELAADGTDAAPRAGATLPR
jgi:putative MFS transporter